jgi:hypothetical protein
MISLGKPTSLLFDPFARPSSATVRPAAAPSANRRSELMPKFEFVYSRKKSPETQLMISEPLVKVEIGSIRTTDVIAFNAMFRVDSGADYSACPTSSSQSVAPALP